MSKLILNAFPHDRSTLRAIYMMLVNCHSWTDSRCRDYFGQALGRPLSDAEWHICTKKEKGWHILS